MLTQLVLTNEEELKLRYFKDETHAKLCKVDAFLKTIVEVPFAFKRVDAMLYVSNFYLEVNQLRTSYATLEVKFQNLIVLSKKCFIELLWKRNADFTTYMLLYIQV